MPSSHERIHTQTRRRLTVADLERMTTHELAELLGTIVLLLRRLPDVPLQELEQEVQGQRETRE